MDSPVRQVPLHFSAASRAGATHTNLSAVRTDGEHLWVAGDETATVERLTAQRSADGAVTGYADEVSTNLADLVDLPAGAEEEADLEGIARNGPWLWAVGSHSLKRKKIRDHDSDAKARKRLGKVVREENRYVLARLPVDPATGLPARRVEVDGEELTAAVLGGRGDSLTDLLDDDDLLEPFLAIPSKDNGVDVEGIAAHQRDDGEVRLYVGFRGPVLRGWAVVVEVRPETDPDDPHRLRLARFGDGPGKGERYRLHLLDLGGLGVRDLCPHGEDLLVLAGPSMSLSGPVRVHRWVGACAADAAEVVRADELPLVLELPHGQGEDHAEGIAVLPPGAHGTDHGEQLLVVLDSPAAARHAGDGAMLADVWDLPPA
ncbi:DUF3616 domain-containing protein [Kineococcus esterisolvens]|uniref:DUF3616 domain-containing protein n=1 Tax=unclassified Kineococcus TaxID=2621656 RepID=UPI003D7EAA0C